MSYSCKGACALVAMYILVCARSLDWLICKAQFGLHNGTVSVGAFDMTLNVHSQEQCMSTKFH